MSNVKTVARALSRIRCYRNKIEAATMDPSSDVHVISRSVSRIVSYRAKAMTALATIEEPMVRDTLAELVKAA